MQLIGDSFINAAKAGRFRKADDLKQCKDWFV